MSDGATPLAFDFLPLNERDEKPRTVGLTEIRGPFYSAYGLHHMQDIFRSVGRHIDSFKFGAGTFALMPRDYVADMVSLCREHDIDVSTGGALEYVLRAARDQVGRFLDECRDLGFTTIEISSGFLSIPAEDLLRLVELVVDKGLKAKPEIAVQFGAGGTSDADELEALGQVDLGYALASARRFLDAGADIIMIESEGITEAVHTWRTDIPGAFARELGIDKLMFEAADPEVFAWYIKSFGPEVNLFVDHSQIIALECLRRGLWGDSQLWGRVVTFK